MLKEFKEFAMKGNVMDMAIGIILGAAFGKIVASFVNDVLMPPIGMALGGVNFTDLGAVLKEAEGEAAAVIVKYGSFIQTIIDFLIIAGTIFVVVKIMNNAKRKEEEAPADPTTKSCPKCISEIPIQATKCAHCTSDV
ncbi:MAG: large-conductance mechanosensitive channel protein MscL [Gammaproteobacteria bacterium]|nr:large-conductance mechanosensitive channel protein MscL [Gammaproteobacteria bacterium]NNM13787.1 large-conductance mechanosensitive channel protein MscL [Gammaproteobacteria bacterium]